TNEEPANKGEGNGQEKEGGTLNKEDDQNVQDFRAELDNLLIQQKKGYANSTNRDSIISLFVSIAGQNFTNANDLPTDPLILDLEDTGIFSGTYDDEDVEAMQEELLQFKLQKVWTLVDLLKGKKAIGTKIEAIRLFLAYASFIGLIVYQMDVKSAFLYGTIEEE
ncbi:putative ribonuclease H-like domain-containing protein, partial [Tanacetum coccineum]